MEGLARVLDVVRDVRAEAQEQAGRRVLAEAERLAAAGVEERGHDRLGLRRRLGVRHDHVAVPPVERRHAVDGLLAVRKPHRNQLVGTVGPPVDAHVAGRREALGGAETHPHAGGASLGRHRRRGGRRRVPPHLERRRGDRGERRASRDRQPEDVVPSVLGEEVVGHYDGAPALSRQLDAEDHLTGGVENLQQLPGDARLVGDLPRGLDGHAVNYGLDGEPDARRVVDVEGRGLGPLAPAVALRPRALGADAHGPVALGERAGSGGRRRSGDVHQGRLAGRVGQLHLRGRLGAAVRVVGDPGDRRL